MVVNRFDVYERQVVLLGFDDAGHNCRFVVRWFGAMHVFSLCTIGEGHERFF